jgi:branched-chain amino acid transport system ATP-binding protein
MTCTDPLPGQLRLESLSIPRAGRNIVQEVSLEVPQGQVTALLGPNGAGKSTLVLGVGGVLRSSGGRVMVGDQELTDRRPEEVRASGIAIVPEGRWLLRDLTVEENLRVATYALERGAAVDAVANALLLFPELERRWKTAAGSLSGGEQQMVVLAQAMVSRPKVILVDELSLGLAPVIVKRLIPALEAIAASGVGVLLIEQYAHVALALAGNAYVIEGGRIRYRGTAAELKEQPELLHSAYLSTGTGGAAR